MIRVGSLASGYGGLDLAVCDVLRGDVAWHAEVDPAPSKVLAHRWPGVPNLGDITRVDWVTVEPVDVLVGGYPCQPFSHPGKRKGTADERHIWPWIADAIRILRPGLCVFENVPGHLGLGFDAVLGDLAALGMDARWGVVRASDVGAPHRRERLWIVAHPADADVAGWEGPQPAQRRNVSAGGGGGAVALLPTPRVSDTNGAGYHGDGGMDLRTAALTLLPTPRATDGPKGGPGQRNGRGEADSLPAITALLPTPTAMDSRASGGAVDSSNVTLTDATARSRTVWGDYAPAITRWEHTLGRPAPDPTEPGKIGQRLSPRFVEWMMGLPDGWVTDPTIGLSRTQQLKALGNGVVPRQAAHALVLLLPGGVLSGPDRRRPTETNPSQAVDPTGNQP